MYDYLHKHMVKEAPPNVSEALCIVSVFFFNLEIIASAE